MKFITDDYLLNDAVFGPILIVTITLCSIFLLIRLSFKPFSRPKKLISCLSGKEGFKSACLSLSGTLGVGNISGVASAIIVGGAGAVFWMWVFALMAMIIKYSEIVLALKFKSDNSCGTAFYIEKGLKNKHLAIVFSVLIVLSSLGMGNIIQSSAASQSLYVCFDVPKIVTGVIFSIITLLLVIGGRDRVSIFSSYLIPILTVGYFLVSIAVIIANIRSIPSAFLQIFSEAFNVKAIGGGVLSVLFTRSVRIGASRGILSNEAGCGTATYAQSVKENNSAKGGVWGIFEVFVDTIVLCTLTALVIFLVPNNCNESMGSVIYSYSYFGQWGGSFIGISSWFFALASVVCWSYYGTAAIRYLTKNKKAYGLYLLLYSAAGIVGSVFAPNTVWQLSDITVSIMAVFNTICVVLLSGTVKDETDRYFS